MADTFGSINDGFVQAINAELGARNMAKAELSRRLGIFPSVVNGWIGPDPDKRAVMTTETVHRIAVALGVDVAYLATQALVRTGRGFVPNASSRHISLSARAETLFEQEAHKSGLSGHDEQALPGS
jgi:hypothetical protein